MESFSGLGIGLSLVFGCLVLAFVAEVYYLLFWKKRVSNREIEEENEDYISNKNYAKELFHLICWKKPTCTSLQPNNTKQDPIEEEEEQDMELGTSKDLLIKALGEESVESELMRLHNLSGPPRFLFTIKEETKEDLESDDGKSRGDRSRKGSRTRSLSDLILSVDTPFLTPLASPRLKSSSSPLNPLDYYNNHGFNPLFESETYYRPSSSPPPKFKFLRDAEEKLLKRIMEERALKNGNHQDSKVLLTEETEGSFLGFIVNNRNKERDVIKNHLPQFPSSSSQVLPLASSPTTFSPLEKKP